MSEADIIARTKVPATRESLQRLAKLGVRTGDTLLVHSSMRAMGWVSGGQIAVLQALYAVGKRWDAGDAIPFHVLLIRPTGAHRLCPQSGSRQSVLPCQHMNRPPHRRVTWER